MVGDRYFGWQIEILEVYNVDFQWIDNSQSTWSSFVQFISDAVLEKSGIYEIKIFVLRNFSHIKF